MVSSGPWSNLGQRLGTALILAAVSLGLIWLGSGFFMLEVIVLALAGSCEIFDLVERKRLRPLRRTGTLATLFLLGACFHSGILGLAYATLVSFVALLVMCVLRSQSRVSVVLDGAATLLCVMYVGWLFSSLVLLRALPQGAAWVTLLVVMMTATDTGAYFVGKIFGRHRLCPSLSPKKTVEGSLGGLLLPALFGYGLAPYCGLLAWQGAFLGTGVSVLGQVGDLWESALKREVGVKDAGEFLGSHGGVLDRFDSLAFAAPFFYLTLIHILK